MIPAPRPDALPDLLSRLSDQREQAQAQQVRVRLRDGTELQGELNDASAEHLSLLVGPTEEIHHVAAGEIARLEIAHSSRAREWTVATGAIVGGTGALVGYAALPWTDPAHGLLNAFLGLFVASAVVFAVVKRRTPLGAWLRPWRTLYDRGAA
jgi:hypothetical protein